MGRELPRPCTRIIVSATHGECTTLDELHLEGYTADGELNGFGKGIGHLARQDVVDQGCYIVDVYRTVNGDIGCSQINSGFITGKHVIDENGNIVDVHYGAAVNITDRRPILGIDRQTEQRHQAQDTSGLQEVKFGHLG